MSFEVIEDLVSGDYAFVARGKDLGELFSSCAEACFSAMTDLSKVDPVLSRAVNIGADNLEDLLFNFLAELIYLKDTEKLFFVKFDMEFGANNYSLKAVAHGEAIDYNKHEIRTDVKAVTYHNLEVRKTDGGFEARVILDL